MKLVRQKIKGVPYKAARAIREVITPELVILHDTAGRLEKGNSARYLRNTTNGVSAHFVVERDGSIEQLVPTNRRTGHAGTSNYHGRKGCNSFSIGIEIVNVGKMTAGRPGFARTWFKTEHLISDRDAVANDDSFPTVLHAASSEHGGGYWMDYTSAQIEAVTALLVALFDGIPTLKDVRGHWYISPGRKVDPNPFFPMDQVRAQILGREEPEPDAASDHVLLGDNVVAIETPGDTLNMRRWPSYNPNVIAAIPDGTVVPVVRRGVFSGEEWELVRYGGHEGWVVSRYTADITCAGVPA